MSASHRETGVVEAKTLGKYRLLAGLGRGGMAAVYLAVMEGPAGFSKLVVIKQILPQHSEDPEILGMFLDEARLAARLRHPNVVQTNEIGQDGQHHFMVMEFLDGQPLNRILHRLRAAGALPLAVHLHVIVDLLEGLHHAHELADYDGTPLGVVHRDITPQNVFVTYDGGVKILDFGIAKARSSLVHTGIGIVKGKVAYMAPEQICGETLDRRADIFSVGVMLWEAVTGTRPWKGVPELTALKSVADGHFPSAREVRPDLPDALDAIVRKALARDREQRYATAAELQADLEAYLQSTGERVSRRDLGGLVSAHFTAEHAEIEAIVQAQLRCHDDGASAAMTLPTLDQPTTTGDGPGALHEARPGAPGSSAPHTGPSAFAVSLPDERAYRRSFLQKGALAVAVTLVGVLGWTLKRPTPAEAVPPAVVTTSDRAVSSAPSMVKLRVAASPPGARVSLDGEPLPSNPFEGDVARDGAPHEIVVDAEGFVSRTERVTLDRDLALDLTLAHEPEEDRASPIATRGTLVAGGSTGHGFARVRHLDATNPYDAH